MSHPRALTVGLVVLVLVAPLALLAAPLFASAQPAPAGIVTGLQGRVTVVRAPAPAPRPLAFRDDVFLRDTVATADQSIARLLLGGKAAVTVRERSVLTITEVPGRSTIELESGKIALAVARDRLRPGESIEVRTGNAIAGIRGTVLVTETSVDPAGVRTTRFSGFRGTTDVAFLDPTGAFSRQLTLVADNFALGVGTAPPTSGLMTPEQRVAALSGLQMQTRQVAGGQDSARDSALGATLATFAQTNIAAIVPSPPATPPPLPALNPPALLPFPDQQPVDQTQAALGATAPTPPALSPPPPPPPSDRIKPPGTGIAIFGDRGERDILDAHLRELQPNRIVFKSDSLPSDLPGPVFGTAWHVGAFAPLTGEERTRLRDFLATGGGVYLTGERPCCEELNDSITALVRAVVKGGEGITVGRQGDIAEPYAFNPGARDGVTTTPNALGDWLPLAPGGIAGVGGPNVLVASAGGIPVGAVWDEGDLVGDRGRLALLMDVNWLANLDPDCNLECRRAIVENLLTFLDDPPAPLVLAGPLFRSVAEAFDTAGPLLEIARFAIVGGGSDPLLWFAGTRVTSDHDIVRVSDSDIRAPGTFLRAEHGAELIQRGSEPMVSVYGGTLSVGEGGSGHLVEALGRADRLHADPDPDPVTGGSTGLVLGIDQPLQPGPGAPVLAASGGAVVDVRGSAYRADAALLEATAPVLALAGQSTMTTGRHAVDLAGRARVSLPADSVAMISVNASRLDVRQGHLVNVAGGSRLNVAGDLLRLSHGGRVDIADGLLLNLSGGSVAGVGTLVRFTGSGNLLTVQNTLAPTALIGGIPVFAPAGSVKVTTATPIAGLGTAGSIVINGVPLTPTTPLSSLTGSLVGVQGAGSVRIGP
jgi:hypothetical protein